MKIELTEDELKLILEKRKQEEQPREEQPRPVKVGYLKHTLYANDSLALLDDIENEEYITEKQVTELIEKITNWFKETDMKLEKGTPFKCYLDMEDGSELWYDDYNFGIEDMVSDWAENNLEDIKKCK